MYFMILGYNEINADYSDNYIKTVGSIINKNIESDDVIEKKNGTNIFKHKKKFRIKLKYKYSVEDSENNENNEYYGEFYNNGINDNFLDENEYIPIGNIYNYVKKINVFYNKDNYYNSCVNLEKIKQKNKKIYSIICLFLLSSIPIILFY